MLKDNGVEKVELFKSSSGELFDNLEDAERDVVKTAKITDLKKLVRPYLKEHYSNAENFLEDVFVGLIENEVSAVDIIDRPF